MPGIPCLDARAKIKKGSPNASLRRNEPVEIGFEARRPAADQTRMPRDKN
jgi:hypothetical protein